MGKTKTPTQSTAEQEESSPSTSAPQSPGEDMWDILEMINNRMASFDSRLAHLYFTRKFNICTPPWSITKNKWISCPMRTTPSVEKLTDKVKKLTTDDRKMKQSVLDVQMQDSLVFPELQEQAQENGESCVKKFFLDQLKLPADIVSRITFYIVYYLLGRRNQIA